MERSITRAIACSKSRRGINGATSKLALRNADHDLKELLNWLDAHPAVKAVTDVMVTLGSRVCDDLAAGDCGGWKR